MTFVQLIGQIEEIDIKANTLSICCSFSELQEDEVIKIFKLFKDTLVMIDDGGKDNDSHK